MSYGTSLADLYRQVGVYARSHPQRRKAVDLPVIQTTKFEFIINLQTARLLDFTTSPCRRHLLARAGEVIE